MTLKILLICLVNIKMDEEQSLKDLKNKFIKINNGQGDINLKDGKTWYLSHRNGDTGIGKTFEDLLGKKEDNFQLPDYENIELKAHLDNNSLITLFTKSPNLPRGINTLIRNTYGYSVGRSNIKVLHSTVTSGEPRFNSKSQHYFSIRNNKKNKSVDLVVLDKDKKEIINGVDAKWSYEVLEKVLTNKMPNKLVIILTDKKVINKKTYYNYKSMFVTSVRLSNLLKALDDGCLSVDLRLGVYKSGKNKGKTHDNGTGFRISLHNLFKYTDYKRLI